MPRVADGRHKRPGGIIDPPPRRTNQTISDCIWHVDDAAVLTPSHFVLAPILEVKISGKHQPDATPKRNGGRYAALTS